MDADSRSFAWPVVNRLSIVTPLASAHHVYCLVLKTYWLLAELNPKSFGQFLKWLHNDIIIQFGRDPLGYSFLILLELLL